MVRFGVQWMFFPDAVTNPKKTCHHRTVACETLADLFKHTKAHLHRVFPMKNKEQAYTCHLFISFLCVSYHFCFVCIFTWMWENCTLHRPVQRRRPVLCNSEPWVIKVSAWAEREQGFLGGGRGPVTDHKCQRIPENSSLGVLKCVFYSCF